MKLQTGDDEAYVEKSFKLKFKDFETRFFVPVKFCSVCDGSPGQETRVRQLEPTFSDQSLPEYDFDHGYDFVVTKLKFAAKNELSTQVYLMKHLFDCPNC